MLGLLCSAFLFLTPYLLPISHPPFITLFQFLNVIVCVTAVKRSQVCGKDRTDEAP